MSTDDPKPERVPHRYTCRHCDRVMELSIDPVDLDRWREGTLIQHALPYLSADEREMVLSRTCPSCWDRMMSEDLEGLEAQ